MKTDQQFITRLAAAYIKRLDHDPMKTAALHFKCIRAIVRAVLPGKQTRKNIDDALAKAVTAACRCIRTAK